MTAQPTGKPAKARNAGQPASSQAVPYGRLLSGTASLGGPIGLSAGGAPWWIVLLSSTLGLVVICLQGVFPQNSADRLAWWRDLRRSRERKATRRAQKQSAEPRQHQADQGLHRRFAASAARPPARQRRCH